MNTLTHVSFMEALRGCSGSWLLTLARIPQRDRLYEAVAPDLCVGRGLLKAGLGAWWFHPKLVATVPSGSQGCQKTILER
jgi:hypothetical protein